MTHTFYTGVGNRKVPREALDLCREIGRELALRGLTLRTGDTDGSDAAFLSGCQDGQTERGADRNEPEVYRPEDDLHPWAIELAARVVGVKAWLKASESMRRLSACNAMQVLGRDGQTPSKFLLCWSRNIDPRMQDGTRVAVRIADDFEGCRSEQRPPAVDFADRIPWLNLRGLTLPDALAFAHQHAGVPVLRPGDVLPARLVPEGALYSRARHTQHAVKLDGQFWRVSDDQGLWYPANSAADHVPPEVTIVSLGWAREKINPRALERSALAYWNA